MLGEQFDTVLDRKNPAQGFMGALVMVSVRSIGRHFAHLLQAAQDMAIEYFGAVSLRTTQNRGKVTIDLNGDVEDFEQQLLSPAHGLF